MGAATQVASLFALITLDDQMSGGIKSAQKGLTGFSKTLKKSGKDIRKLGSTMTKSMTLPIVALGAVAIKAAADWEDSFAGVLKTVDGTTEELAELEQGLRDLATSADSPVSALANAHTELAGVAEAAGQLGVELPDVLKFTETMGLLGMATDLAAEEAAVLSAQFANITGMDIGEDIDNFAASLVHLGNNSATTEGTILQLAQRIALAGKNAGLHESDILAMAAAVASLGFAPERAGTNISRFLNTVSAAVQTGGDDLALLAKVAGTDPKFFREKWETDSKTALVDFLTGLGALDLSEQLAILDQLGLSGATTQEVILALAGDEGIALLTTSLEGSAKAWEDGTAAIEEGGKRADTTKGQFNKLKNNINDLAITVGEELLPPLNKGITALTNWIMKLQETNPQVIKFAIAGLVLLAALGPLITIIGGVATVVGVLAGAFGLLFGAMLPITLPLLLIAALLAAYLTDFAGFRGFIDDLREGFEAWGTTLGAIKDIVQWIATNTGLLLSQIVFNPPTSIEEFKQLVATIWNIIQAIAGAAGVLLSAIGFEMPSSLNDLKTLVDDIWSTLQKIGSFDPSSLVTGGGGGDSGGGGLAGFGASVGSAVSGLFKDRGGFGQAGQPVMIGTGAQPELFVPSTSGNFFPAGQLGGGGSTPVHLTITMDSGTLFEGMVNEGNRRNINITAGA
jgi:TP901 family phage tail tape measure protein